MNGTTNFILDAMHFDGRDFSEVLAQAQALGYAEADPSADIDGLYLLEEKQMRNNYRGHNTLGAGYLAMSLPFGKLGIHGPVYSRLMVSRTMRPSSSIYAVSLDIQMRS